MKTYVDKLLSKHNLSLPELANVQYDNGSYAVTYQGNRVWIKHSDIKDQLRASLLCLQGAGK